MCLRKELLAVQKYINFALSAVGLHVTRNDGSKCGSGKGTAGLINGCVGERCDGMDVRCADIRCSRGTGVLRPCVMDGNSGVLRDVCFFFFF